MKVNKAPAFSSTCPECGQELPAYLRSCPDCRLWIKVEVDGYRVPSFVQPSGILNATRFISLIFAIPFIIMGVRDLARILTGSSSEFIEGGGYRIGLAVFVNVLMVGVGLAIASWPYWWVRKRLAKRLEEDATALKWFKAVSKIDLPSGETKKPSSSPKETRHKTERETYNVVYSKLLNLLGGDHKAAERLIAHAKSKFPHKPEQWYVEQVIDEILQDRNRFS